MPTHLTHSTPALPGGPGLTLRDARDLDRHRPRNTRAAIRLDWLEAVRPVALITAALTVPLTMVGAWLDNGGVIAGVYTPLMMGLNTLWLRRGDTLGRESRPTTGTLRSALPLSRRSVVTARYALLFCSFTCVWATSLVTAAALKAALDRPILDLVGSLTTLFVVFVIMQLAWFPTVVRRGQGWALLAGLGALALFLGALFAFTAADGFTFALLHPVITALVALALIALVTYASWRATVRGYLRQNL